MIDLTSPRTLYFWLTRGLLLLGCFATAIIIALMTIPAFSPARLPLLFPVIAVCCANLPQLYFLSRLKRLAKHVKSIDVSMCYQCGYTISHRYAHCTECNDKTPPLERDRLWLRLLQWTKKPLEFYAQSPLATPDQVQVGRDEIKAPQDLLSQHRKRSRQTLWAIAVIVAVGIAAGVMVINLISSLYLPFYLLPLPVLVMAPVLIQYQLRYLRSMAVACIFAYRNSAFCIPCGCPLSHTHDPCPQCADNTPAEIRDQWWAKFYKTFRVKLPSSAPQST